MRFNIIFATNNNLLFGSNNTIPWHCPRDLKYFNNTTTYNDELLTNTIVMGKNTWQSLPNKLPDRYNVVISSTIVDNNIDFIFDSLDSFINNYKTNGKVFIIGGVRLIDECFNKYLYNIDKIYYSKINNNLNDGIFINENIIDMITNNTIHSRIYSDVSFFIAHIKHEEYQYLNILEKCLKQEPRQTRNAITYSYFSDTMTFDLQKGFPLITTKKVFIRGIFEELIFFLKGNTNSKLLEEKNVNIWKPNTTQEFINSVGLEYKEGDMGPMYGFNWKHFGAEYIDCDTDYTNKGFNQIEYVFDLLINDPMSRRIIMTDYNPSVAKYGVLYPCHSIVIQFYVKPVNDKLYVSMNMYQRSVDVFLGEVFNIASNALLLHLVCNTLNVKTNSEKYIADKLTIVMGDIHIYEQHITAVKEQLQRIPYAFPKLYIKNSYSNIEDYKWEDIEVINYQSHPAIKAPMIA